MDIKNFDSLTEEMLDNMTQEELEEMLNWVSDDYETAPVSMKQFIEDPEYLGKYFQEEGCRPYWKKLFCEEIYPSPYVEKYWLIVFRGSIGKGKTTAACICIAYELHKLLCKISPQKSLGQIPSSKIVFAILNRTMGLSVDVVWDKLSQIFLNSPYFAKYLTVKRRSKDETIFPKRIDFNMGSRIGHTLGQDVLYAILDEANFNVVEDQMYQSFNSILARMESLFMKPGGGFAGKVFVVSSEKDTFSTVNQIVDKHKNTPGVFIDQSALWEVVTHKKGEAIYSGKKFWVFKGSDTRPPEILTDNSNLMQQDPDNCIDVPIEHYSRFEADIHASLRDLAGVATGSSYKLFRIKEKLFRTLIINPIFPDVIRLDFDDETDQIMNYLLDPTFFQKKVDQPRYIHLDMALSGDRLGISAAYVRSLKERRVRDINTFEETAETVPEVAVEWSTAIEASPGKQIPLYKIRMFLMQLSRMGYLIGKVSADLQMLSADTLQGLQKVGFDVEYISVDRTVTPYFTLRTLCYEDRIYLPNSALLKKELLELDVEPDGTKVDHPPKGSKDMADSVSGSVFLAIQNADRNKLLFFQPRKTAVSNNLIDTFWPEQS